MGVKFHKHATIPYLSVKTPLKPKNIKTECKCQTSSDMIYPQIRSRKRTYRHKLCKISRIRRCNLISLEVCIVNAHCECTSNKQKCLHCIKAADKICMAAFSVPFHPFFASINNLRLCVSFIIFKKSSAFLRYFFIGWISF